MLLTGAMLLATVPVSGAFAADQAPVLKAAPVAPVGWYFHGGFEAGGRYVFDRPGDGYARIPGGDWLKPTQIESRQKFEEYGEVPSGVFLDWINLQAGSLDGKYAIDFWARSVGLNSQSYWLNAAIIGQHYLTLGWDETPHLISTSAKSLFGGVGTTYLSVSDAVQAALQAQAPNASVASPAGQLARNNIENIINNNVNQLTLFTQRDKAIGAYRWTPTPDWDFKADYTHEDRTGVRPLGIAYGYATTRPASGNSRPTNIVEVPQPIDDTTQNVNASGEYVGVTPWGTKWTTMVKYTGSFYDNSLKYLDVENPYCLTCLVTVGPAGTPFGPRILRMALDPSNQSNAITWSSGVDIPILRSRYTSTFQYNMMQQNDPFVSTATNGVVPPPFASPSLNGEVNTTLWNGVLTSRLTDTVSNTLKGRYYDIDNRTPERYWGPTYNFGDSGLTTLTGEPTVRTNLALAYTKTNISDDIKWQTPVKWIQVGAGAGWERYDRTRRDVDVTDEWLIKAFMDATPLQNIHARGSYQYSERRYKNYDPIDFVEHPAGTFSEVASNLRRFDLANRNRAKGDFAVEIALDRIVTVVPNFGMRWDDYPDAVPNPLGIRQDHTWNGGVEIAALLSPTFRVMGAYNYEQRNLDMAGGSGGANIAGQCSTSAALNPDSIIGPACTWRSGINQRYDTYLAAADWKAIPNTLDFRAEFVMAKGREGNGTVGCPSGNASCVTDPQFPDETNTFERFNFIAKYTVNPDMVRMMGWTGEVFAKARYTWERNHNVNWATDAMTPYIGTLDGPGDLTGGNRSVFLAYNNPNYNAQLIALSLGLRW